MGDIAIKFENISKQYRLGEIGTGTLSHDLNRWWHKVRGLEDPYLKVGVVNATEDKQVEKYVWALRNFNLEVKQGEVLGIIGRNGAGKSTLLKILAKVTKPTTGFIKTKGRIASLLEVGTGFHPEMTGRENIFMNGSIMGMTKAEIRGKFDEIVEFAGIEKFIETPVKRYSSGMSVRLGFAIAAHLDPEILVVDEVLAVGDAEFQKKAIGKIQEISGNVGRTVLFVSHNMTAIKNLCNKTIILNNGEDVFYGNVNDGINTYLKLSLKSGSLEIDELIKTIPPDNVLEIKTISITQNFLKIRDFAYSDLPIDIQINYQIKVKVNNFRMFIDLTDTEETLILRSFHDENDSSPSVIPPGKYSSKVQIPPNLLGPTYYEIRIQAGIYNQRYCIPPDRIRIRLKIHNLEFNKAYPYDTFRQKIAPILKWETKAY